MCWDPSIPIAMADEICGQPEFRYYSGGLQGSYTAGLRITLDFDPPLFQQAQVNINKSTAALVLFSILWQKRGEVLIGKAHSVSFLATEITILCWKTTLGLFHSSVLLRVLHQYGTPAFVCLENSVSVQPLCTKQSFRNENFCPKPE